MARTNADAPPYTARLLIGCPDRPGIVAAVSTFLFERGANIVSSHQYSSDAIGGRFFLRTELFLEQLSSGAGARERFAQEFAREVAERFQMDWEIRWWGERRRVAILVSRHDHCLFDLLWRWRRGELEGEMVDRDLKPSRAGGRGDGSGRRPSTTSRCARAPSHRPRRAMLERLAGQADLLVLARYMQILSGEFLVARRDAGDQHPPLVPAGLPRRRSLAPGARARGQADRRERALRHRGARRGADHRAGRRARRPPADRADLERVGRDVERRVLARAVALHLADRVIVDGRRTVVF